MKNVNKFRLLALVPALLAALMTEGLAQEYDEDESVGAYCAIQVDWTGRTDVSLSCYGVDSIPDTAALRASLLRGLEQCLGCSLTGLTTYGGPQYFWISGKCRPPLQRQGQAVQLNLHPAALWDKVRETDAPRLSLTILHPKMGFSRCPQAASMAWQGRGTVGYAIQADGRSRPPETVTLWYGYGPFMLPVIIGAAVVLMAAAMALLARARRNSLRLARRDPTAAWFGFWKVQRWTNEGLWMAWVTVLLWLGADGWTRFTSPPQAAVLNLAILMLPVSMAGIACQLIARSVWREVRSIDLGWQETLGLELWRQAAMTWPVLLLLVGIASLVSRGPHVWLWLLAAALSRMVGTWRYAQATDMKPHALLTGRLRERAFELAQRAGVKLQQLYLMPAGRFQLGNAFALQGNNVILTDYLLGRLSARETDCVLAHEIGHLKHRHTIWLSGLGFILMLALSVLAIEMLLGFIPGILAMALRSGGTVISAAAGWVRSYLVYPAGLLSALIAMLMASRRFERSADEYAALLTNDPEGLVTALFRLAQMNMLPIRWGAWDENLSTHPSMVRRVERIADRHSIPRSKLADLLQQAGQTPQAPGYEIPPRLLDPQRVFTTEFRNRTRLVISLTTLVAVTGAPLALVQLAGLIHPHWPLYVAGLFLMPAFHLGLATFTGLWGYQGLKERLWKSLMAEKPGSGDGIWFVGISPGAEPRVYEGHTVWDVGFLSLTSLGLEFTGDQSSFTIPRENIVAESLTDGFPSWWQVPDVLVEWRGREVSPDRLRLHSVDGGSMLAIGQKTRELHQALENNLLNVRQDGRSGPPAEAEPLPDFGTVSGIPPGQALRPASVAVTMLLVAGVVLVVGSQLRLSPGGLLYACGLAAWALLWGYLPIWRYREKKQPDEGWDSGGPRK